MENATIILIVGLEKKGLARLTLLIQKCLKTINKHFLFKFFFAVSHVLREQRTGYKCLKYATWFNRPLSLYVLISQYRSRGDTLGNCSFKISFCSRAYLRINYEKTKGYKLKRSILGLK